jgi:photosystem II stability/assembly factor-like uncharacterized protein
MKPSRLLLVVLLFAAACIPSQATDFPTPAPRTATVPALPPTATTPPTKPPTATASPATDTAEPTATVETAPGSIAHLAAGTPVTITAMNMLDTTTGWAIGGTGSLGDHVLRTADGGETWADVTPPEPAAATSTPGFLLDAHGHFADADHAWVIYGTTDTSAPTAMQVWRTSDAGATWTGSEPIDASDLGPSDFFAPSDLHFSNAEHGFFVAHLGVGMNHDYFAVYTTADGGATWTFVFGPQSDGPQSCGKTGLRFVDAAHGWLTGDCQGVAPGLFLYATSDGGATWTPASLPPPADGPDLFTRDDAGCGTNSLTAFDAQTLKLAVACLILSTDPIAVQAYVYTTTDGGATWTSSPAPSRGLTFLNPQVGWSLPLTLGFETPPFDLSHTTDGGATWTTVAAVDWYGQLDFVDDTLGWSVAHTAAAISLLRTTDGGATWETLSPAIGPG